MTERWEDVTGYQGLYQVSDLGNVRRIKGYRCRNTHILKYGLTNKGYQHVNLWKRNKARTYTIHGLVLKAFVGPRPHEHQCRHLDGNKINNKIENLRCGTNSENQLDRAIHGTSNRGEQSVQSKLTDKDVLTIKYLINQNVKQPSIAKKFNISPKCFFT